MFNDDKSDHEFPSGWGPLLTESQGDFLKIFKN